MCLAHDNSLVVTGNDAGVVEVWGTDDGKRLCSLQLGQTPIRSIEPIPGTDRAVVACRDGVTAVVRISGSALEEIRRVKAHERPITHVATSPDGRWFATASADGSAKVWTTDAGELVATLVGADKDPAWVWDVAFTPDSRALCTGGTDRICRVWDVEKSAVTRQITCHKMGVTCLAVIP